MKEAFGNMLHVDCDALCVTTNGFVTSKGTAVMGRGIALSIARAIPDIHNTLGKLMLKNGNVTQIIMEYNNIQLIAFPVKPIYTVNQGNNIVSHVQNSYAIGETVPGFHAKAELKIIKQSAEQLVKLTDAFGWNNVILPRPGCGAGELEWTVVKPVLEKILNDRFTCYTFTP